MRVKTYLMVTAIALLISPYVFAQEHDHHGHEGSMMDHVKSGESTVVEAGNKVCPVSGQKVGEMGPAVKVEHEGKIYNLCCAGCVAAFKKDPEKFVKILEKEQESKNEEQGHYHDH